MESEDSSTEEFKKRKAGNEMEEAFGRSKKILRSPAKQRNGDEKLELIINMIKEMKEDQSEIKEEIHQIRVQQREIKKVIGDIKEENEKLRKENEQIKNENREIRGKIKALENTVEWMEKEKRKNNIVMYGLKIDTNDSKTLKQATEKFMEQQLNINVRVNTANKIGDKTCLIKLETEQDKEEIMKNKSKLRNLTTDKVYINNDLTKKEKEKQKYINERAKQEISAGKTVKIGFNKIIINGTEWRWNKDKEKLEEKTIPKN